MRWLMRWVQLTRRRKAIFRLPLVWVPIAISPSKVCTTIRAVFIPSTSLPPGPLIGRFFYGQFMLLLRHDSMEWSCWCPFRAYFCGRILNGVNRSERAEVISCITGASRIFSRCIPLGSICQPGFVCMMRNNTWVYLFLRNGFDLRRLIGVSISQLYEVRWSNSSGWIIRWPLQIAGLLLMATPHAC